MGRLSWRNEPVVSRRSLALAPQPPTLGLAPQPPRLWRRTDGHRRDPPPLHRALRGGRSPGSALRVAAGPRPDAAVRERRHGAVQALLPGPGDTALLAGD